MNPSAPASSDSPQWLEFEHFYYTHSDQADEYGDPEVVDVSENHRAAIPPLEPGKIVEGQIFSAAYADDGGHHLIFDADERGFLAIRTEVYLPNDRIHWYQARTVTLDEPGRPLAWEILGKNELGVWTPLEAQHLRSRTAPAESWVLQLHQPLMRLKDQERILQEESRDLHERLQELGQARPSEPSPQISPSRSRPEYRFGSNRLPAKEETAPHEPVSVRPPLTKRLFNLLPFLRPNPTEPRASETESQDHTESAKSREVTEAGRGVEPVLNSKEIEVRLYHLGRALKRVGRELELGNGLVQHLEHRRGTSVTLQESAIEGRQAEMVPVRPAMEQMAVTISAGPRIRP